MRTSIRAIGLLCWFASALAIAGPREDVKDVAVLINDYYFDAQRAATIAGDLRRDADAGAFDRFTDADDLAVELTRRLRALDAHFNVIWEGAADASRASAASLPGESASGSQPNASPPSSQPRPTARSPSREPRPTSTAASPVRDMQPVAPVEFETVDRRASYGFRRVERLPGNIGYIDLSFAANIDFADKNSPSRRAADAALGLMHGADAIIIDIRQNGGGSPAMVGYLVSAFVEPGKDVYNVFHSRTGTESERPDIAYPDPMLTVPLYVLTSARTASAAESIAYTLQTCGRAKIVGERTAGAANPGMMFRTQQGFAIFVSTGAPRNPLNDRNWEGEGVQPDIETSGARALLRAQVMALEGALSGPIAGFERADAQWALDALRVSSQPYKPARVSGYVGTYGPFTVTAVDGTLEAKRGRQPPLPLVPLEKDVFYVSGEPSRRFAFVRTNDRIVAVEVRRSRGDGQHFNREPPRR